MPLSLFVEVKHGIWTWNFTWCLLYAYLDVFLCSASIVHMTVISLDRYLGISKPLKIRNKSRTVVALKIAFVWIMTTIISSPLAVLAFIDKTNVLRENSCVINNRYYMIYGSTLSFLIPFIIMVLTFMRTTHLLKKQATQLNISLNIADNTGKAKNGLKQNTTGTHLKITNNNGLRRTMISRQKLSQRRINSLRRSNSSGSSQIQLRMAKSKDTKYKTGNVSRVSLCVDQLNLPLSTQSIENEQEIENFSTKSNKLKYDIWDSPSPLLQNNLPFNTSHHITTETNNSVIITNKYNQKKMNSNNYYLINKINWKKNNEKNNNQSTINSISIENKKYFRQFSVINTWQNLTNVWRAIHVLLTSTIQNKKLNNNHLEEGKLRRMSGGRVAAAFRRGKHAATSFKRRSTSMELANEEKASRVLAFVFSSFFICWTPFFLSNFARGFCGESCAAPEWAESLFLWLGYASSTLNPIIYTTFNKRFRQAFSRILRCHCNKSHNRQLNSSYTWFFKHSLHSKTQNTLNSAN